MVHDQAVGLAKLGDLAGVEPSSQIKLSKARPVKEMQDKAQVCGSGKFS